MGFEIADTTGLGDDLKGSLVVLLEGGSNPITAEEWETYVPPPGYMLNTPRAGWFNELIVLGSPFVPTGEITNVTTPDGYTWDSVAAVQRSVYPYIPVTVNGQTLSPQEIAYAITTPPPGIVFIDSNDKNHENIYYGTDGENGSAARLQYFIEDLWGNIYILKSLNAANSTDELVAQAVADAVLPVGWTKPEPRYFTQDMVYGPALSGPGDSIAHANEFRDSADSAWMQIEWAANGMTLNAAAEGGLPIWAGPQGGRLLGSFNDDMMYGAQGDDLFFAGLGNDVMDGGQGLNHAYFAGEQSDYLASRIDNDTLLIFDQIAQRDGSDTLIRVQRAHFTDNSLGFDTAAQQATGASYRMYGVFDRVADAQGQGYWINSLDQGLELTAMAQAFLDSAEYSQLYAEDLTDSQFINELYTNLLQRDADEAGLQFWEEQLASGAERASVLVGFSESVESVELYSGALENGATYVAWNG